MSLQDRLNARVQYYTLLLLLLIARRLLFPDIDRERDRKELFLLSNIEKFVEKTFGG